MTAAVRDAEPFDLVIHSAALIATVDDQQTEVSGSWLAVRDGRIAALGSGAPPSGSE